MRFLTLVLLSFVAPLFADSYLLELKANQPDRLEDYLSQKGYDVAGVNHTKSQVGVVTDSPALLILEQQELSKNKALSFEILSQTKSEPFETFSARVAGTADETAYLGVEETNEALRDFEKKYPKFAKVYNLNALTGSEKTTEGRDIFALQVSRNPGKIEGIPKILILGQHHARELTTQHAVLDSAKDYLEKIVAGENQSTLAVGQVAVWFVPVLNPDGLNHVMKTDRMWRKNRAKNANGSRGVDLNRNYGFKWGACGMHSEDQKSEVYKGPKAMSEPEVRLMDKVNALLRFQYGISYHSYGDEVLNPYLCATLAETEVYNRVRDRLMSTLGYGKRPPSSSGEDHEYHYNQYGTLSFLLEIGEEFQPPFATYQKEIQPKVKKVLPLLLEEALTTRVDFNLVDAETGKPLIAKLDISEIQFKEGEKRESDSFGLLHWSLPKGSYNFHVSAEGFEEGSQSFQSTGGVDSIEVKLHSNRFSLNGLGLFARFFP